jgi:hypothetical protein
LLSKELEYFISVIHWFDASENLADRMPALERHVRTYLHGAVQEELISFHKPTQWDFTRALVYAWAYSINYLVECGTITDKDYRLVVSGLADTGILEFEDKESLGSYLLSVPEARSRAFIDCTEHDFVRYEILNPLSARAQQILYALHTGMPIKRELHGIRFVLVPPGTIRGKFINFSAFYLSETLVSESQWARVMDLEDGDQHSSSLAVTGVSVQRAITFLRRAAAFNTSGLQIHLPTLEQWRFALALGTGGAPDTLKEPRLYTNPFSALGIYDILGVAWQFCRTESSLELRGGSYMSGLPPYGGEPEPIPCENSALCGQDYGLRLVLALNPAY